MFGTVARPALRLTLPLLLGAGCASAPATVSAPHGWRPLPSKAVAAHCQPDARQCHQEGLQALAQTPPDAYRAQNLLAAACGADVEAACQVLDHRFRAPSAVRVPALSASPPYGTAVVEFSCRVTAEGTLESCNETRSANADARILESALRQVAASQSASLFRPATLDGTPYATDVRLVYVLRSESIGGPILGFNAPDPVLLLHEPLN